jgi:hypothetical protein
MLQVKMIKNWRNFKILYILNLFVLQWVKLTFKQYIFGISEQFAIRKSTILIYRATSIFYHLMKIKYAEIDFTSHHSFLRVRRDQFRQNCKKTHPILHSITFFFLNFYRITLHSLAGLGGNKSGAQFCS